VHGIFFEKDHNDVNAPLNEYQDRLAASRRRLSAHQRTHIVCGNLRLAIIAAVPMGTSQLASRGEIARRGHASLLTEAGPRVEAYWTDPGNATASPPQGAQDGGAAAQAAELAKAEVEKAKITDATNRWKIKLENDRQRDKMEAEFVLDCMKLSFESGQTIDPQPIIASMRAARPNDPEDTPPPNPALTPEQPPA